MLKQLDNFKTAVMPDRKSGFWQMVGTGCHPGRAVHRAGRDQCVASCSRRIRGEHDLGCGTRCVFCKCGSTLKSGDGQLPQVKQYIRDLRACGAVLHPVYLITLFSWIAPGWDAPRDWLSKHCWSVLRVGARIHFGP